MAKKKDLKDLGDVYSKLGEEVVVSEKNDMTVGDKDMTVGEAPLEDGGDCDVDCETPEELKAEVAPETKEEDEEVTISSENTEDESTITPSKMLSFYEDGYTYSMDIIQNVNGRKIQYVKLLPIDSNSEIKHVLLGIDSNTKHIYNLIEIGNNNTKTILTVNSFKTNEPLSKTLFTFDESKYSEYYINKLD